MESLTRCDISKSLTTLQEFQPECQECLLDSAWLRNSSDAAQVFEVVAVWNDSPNQALS